ncbi:hypothetical protein NUW54_g14056 [Trametes sanguinea]|uniref:Uncharacterized protein n=1 Tax=Trametes sanguinea TaxID=158606 RepID=A0ACC1MHA6_9APHY|nr:hypothetical protein NUW54_g14056 [Trametes sanguinea]
MPASDLGFNIWGVISSVLGTIALTPVFIGWLKPRLPTSLITGVVEIYKETQDIFITALRDGLITDADELHHFKDNLLELMTCTTNSATIDLDRLRAEVYAIKTWRQDVAKWWRGLSGRIWILQEKLNSMRADLAQRTSNERLKLAAQYKKRGTSDGKLEASGKAAAHIRSRLRLP